MNKFGSTLIWNDLKVQPRLAGMVTRYHTNPVLRKQPISDHVYNMMRIWYLIWGPLPSNISTNMLWHDSGELVTSDISHQTKKEISPDALNQIKELECKAVKAMGGPEHEQVSEYEAIKIKICDLLEMLEFGILEEAFGCHFGRSIIHAAYTALEHYRDKVKLTDAIKVGHYLIKVIDTAKQYGLDQSILPDLKQESPTVEELVDQVREKVYAKG